MSQPSDGVGTVGGYSPTIKLLHWLVALCVAALIGLGLAMTQVGFGIETTVRLYGWHKSIGLTVFALLGVRVMLRWRSRVPPFHAPGLRDMTARSIHGVLYGLLALMAITGWLQVSAAVVAFPTVLFGLVEVPHFSGLASLGYDDRLKWSAFLSGTHRALAWTLIGVIVAHVAGALVRDAAGRRPFGRMLRRRSAR